MGGLPPKLMEMYKSVSALPPIDPSALASLTLADPGKRRWEVGEMGYRNWTVAQLLERTDRAGGEPGGGSSIDALVEKVEEIGPAERLRRAAEAVSGSKEV